MSLEQILEFDFKSRAYDGKWQLLGKILDTDNSYSYKTESGNKITLTPEKWITLAVYDFYWEAFIEAEDALNPNR
jgi:hypothetical protein